MGEEPTSKVKMYEVYFHKFKKKIQQRDSYDGTCPFDQFEGGECSSFEWKSCSECRVFKEHVEINKCPKCGSPILDKWSGIKCSNENCDYWFCF